MKDKAVTIFTVAGILLCGAVSVGTAFQKVVAEQDASTPSVVASKPKYGRSEAVVACQMKLERTLRDPGSVRYDRNLTAYVYEDNLHKVALVYNAKNGFGGYAGQDIYTCAFK